jgi:hypothetical protein
MIEPQVQPLVGFPGAWTAGTNGTATADVVRVQIDSEDDFAAYKGKLAGKIALLHLLNAGRAGQAWTVDVRQPADMVHHL